MDQIKIGRFIAEHRKNANLTQAQLAEMLNITDRAVSKWETGKAMPDSSIMLALCDILGISVNELLNGERINMENKDQKKEELLLEMAKEVEQKNRTIWTCMWIIMSVSVTALLAGVLIAALWMPEGFLRREPHGWLPLREGQGGIQRPYRDRREPSQRRCSFSRTSLLCRE